MAEFARAWESADLDALVALLTGDVFISMPPMPFGYEGRDVVARFCASLFDAGRRLAARRAFRHRLVAIRYSQVRSEERPSKAPMPCQAASPSSPTSPSGTPSGASGSTCSATPRCLNPPG